MITPDGHLYSREAILANLLQQKKAIKRKTAEWEAQQKAEADKVRLPVFGCACGGGHKVLCGGTMFVCLGAGCVVEGESPTQGGSGVLAWARAPPSRGACAHQRQQRCAPGPPPRPAPPQAAQKAAVEAEAALIAFDRSNHMGIRDETAAGIQAAITAEADAIVEGRAGGAKGVVALEDMKERARTMKVRGAAGGGGGGGRGRARGEGGRKKGEGQREGREGLGTGHWRRRRAGVRGPRCEAEVRG